MIATDGVYFRSPHPGLELSETELGKWSSKELSNLTIVMPGVYYHDGGRRALGSGTVAVKSRGIPAASFAEQISRLDTAFNVLLQDPARAESWPVLDIPIKFQVKSPKAALNEGKWLRAGTVARDVERKLSTDPSLKRRGPVTDQLYLFGVPEGIPYVRDGVVRTSPYERGKVLESAPYTRDFGVERDDWGVSPDGDIQGEFLDLLRGD